MHWGVQDFKGLIKGDVDLSRGRVSVLAGANSSGKSSVLQSVLMAAQSLYHDGATVLNGPLVRLGTASELVRQNSDSGVIRIDLSFDTPEPDSEQEPTNLNAELDLIPSPDNITLSVQRLRMTLTAEPETGALELDMYRSRSSDVDQVVSAMTHSTFTNLLHLKASLGDKSRSLRTYVAFQGLVPIEVIRLDKSSVIMGAYKAQIAPLLEQILDERSVPRSGPWMSNPGIIMEFSRLLKSALEANPDDSVLYVELLRIRNGNPYRFAKAWAELSEQDRSTAITLAAEARGKNEIIRLPLAQVSNLRPLGMRMRGLLESKLEERLHKTVNALTALGEELSEIADRVQYLGPLRDEPRVVWNQWNELARGLPVGLRGEYSAVVLSRDQRLEYTTPAGAVEIDNLNVAVNKWLAYLEIGDSVSAKNLGKLGVGVEVMLEGKSRDLTSVGVGVSQALPLVVAFLAVPFDSIFIVEQPELHLHPAVQSRLADFLIMARPDVTLLVETHSEAFLTRVRRRVAEGRFDPAKVDLVFVEQSTRGGARTRHLAMTEFGDLTEWPAGFLGTSLEDAAAILRANTLRLQGGPVAK